MKRAILNGIHEPVRRIYGTLKYFTGLDGVYKRGDLLFVSTQNNEDYDLIIESDGKTSFIPLYEEAIHGGGGGGGGGSDTPAPNTVGTDQIIDGSINEVDLSDDVRGKLTQIYDETGETLYINGAKPKA